MATQFISTNKNYKRLFNAPLDPTLTWENQTALRNYLNDPTCYVNQIVGCSGKAYIVIEKNGVKDIKEIGTIKSSDGSVVCELDSQIFVGDTEPTDDEIVWIDTSDSDEEYSGNISDLVIEEFREIFKNLNNEITRLKEKNYELEARIIYLENNGGGGVSGGDNTSDDIILTLEDGSVLTFEDGSILTLEGSSTTK